MRIAYFTDTCFPQINGIAVVMKQLTEYLNKQKIDHMIFAPDYQENELQEEQNIIRCKGISPVFYPECRLSFPLLHTIKNHIREFQPDLIHIMTEFGVGTTGLRVAKELGIPIIMSYHTNFDRYMSSYHLTLLKRPYWHYMRRFHNQALINFCPSKDTIADLKLHGIKNLELCPNGIEQNLFHSKQYSSELREQLGGKDRTIFLYVGRISKEKGLDRLMYSIHELNVKYGDRVRFVFTGDGPYKEELESQKIPNTIFTGIKTKKELAKIYASCDIFMFPSGTETFGNVVMEAMASGLPIVCPNAGGIRDFTEHGKNAYITKYLDQDDFTKGMIKLTDNIILRQYLREGALRTAQNYAWHHIFDNMMQSCQETLDQNRTVEKLVV